MNYELAKKLKDAGFPVHPECGTCRYDGIAQFKPTLSELIEACGDGFANLGMALYADWKWRAVGKGIFGASVTGDTPEEAVAELWLRLNNK